MTRFNSHRRFNREECTVRLLNTCQHAGTVFENPMSPPRRATSQKKTRDSVSVGRRSESSTPFLHYKTETIPVDFAWYVGWSCISSPIKWMNFLFETWVTFSLVVSKRNKRKTSDPFLVSTRNLSSRKVICCELISDSVAFRIRLPTWYYRFITVFVPT